MTDAMRPWHLDWKTAFVDGRTVEYGVAGVGTPFIFLHGWGLRDRTYQRAMSRLARLGVQVFAPSLPGFGGTEPLPESAFSIDGYARWVASFAAAVGIEGDVYLGGHSFGGGVAIKAAHDHLPTCRLLVLVNSIGGAVWKRDQRDRSADRLLADRPIWDWGIHFPGDVAKRRILTTVTPVIVQDALRNLLRDPLGFWRVGTLAREANLLPELEDLKRRRLPIVVLWGDEDRILPSASLEAIVSAVGHDAQVVDGNHTWLLADPDRFGEVMTNVVAAAEAARLATRRAERRSTRA